MCEAINLRPSFKGVIVTSAFLSFAVILANPIDGGVPYCVYLDQSQELRCNCQNFGTNETSVFPNNDFFVAVPSKAASEVKEAAAVQLTGCERLNLHLDLRPLPHPFYRELTP